PSSTGATTQPTTQARGGEQPAPTETTKRDDEAAMVEALEVSRKAQLYAYQRDRSRETTTRGTGRARRYVTTPGTDGAGAPMATVNEALKHTPDSNRAPLKKTSEFHSSYGSLGKAAAPTIEAM